MYVLVIITFLAGGYASGYGVASIRFTTIEACEAAKAFVAKYRMDAECVRDPTEPERQP